MIKVLIQAVAGSSERRIYDERTLEYQQTRVGGLPYPYPYGFIVGTQAEDDACVDCYVLTRQSLQAGSMVECEPLGLLEQDEDGEIDHKILASLPGESVVLDEGLLEELRAFILAGFARFPEMNVQVGNILPRDLALLHIEQHLEKPR